LKKLNGIILEVTNTSFVNLSLKISTALSIASAPPKISVPICNNSISQLNFNEKCSIRLIAVLDNERPSKTTKAGEPGPGSG
jgi:hypothetical protein